MDNLTHSLVGALLGQAGLKKKTGLAMPALIIGANLPDVDAACFFWLEGTEHLGFRRGITHGPPAWVLLPLVLAGLLWWIDRWQDGRGKRPEGRLPVSFTWLYILSFIGCLSHPLFDWFNVYGIRLLEPFSSQWFYGDTLFIIDVWLWAILALSVWWSLRTEKRGGAWKRPAWVGMVVTAIYIAGNTVWSIAHLGSFSVSNKDMEFPAETMIASPVALLPNQREIIVGRKNEYYIVPAGKDATRSNARPMTQNRCAWPQMGAMRKTDSQLAAFLFWSRAPFAEAAEDGSVILRDARFYDPRARDRFSYALPNVRCVEPDVP